MFVKKLITLILSLLICTSASQEANLPLRERTTERVTIVAHFNAVYDSLRKWEGNYSNIPHDRGKETYGGITRRYNPDWYGWKYIDLEKSKYGGSINRHHRVDNAELWVKDFYLDLWVKQGFNKIENFHLAYYLFDTRVNHNSSPRLINRVLIDMGYNRVEIRKNKEWIGNWINGLDSEEFISKLSHERMKLYHWLVRKDKSQKDFLEGWTKRAKVNS